ncbi:sugar ABC transporter substrate-binding protein [Kordiimonas sp. SCSIO 12603]|uniref:ABC transporter substrate-binding protein n=1 Tax=Kordiimonas sp. SCSIO 12603 TaxID=2829596 RepID=UPI002105E1E6|nr:sugar ABC transporter substrate-binding protein [Kordiimonas sp. SCSIO 12603]UTW59515.1 sugar ABC transporter substrate-binding protein [Kordiimonas sp. SCSIO 12603]
MKKIAIGGFLVILVAVAAFYYLSPQNISNTKKIRIIGEAYAPLTALAGMKSQFEQETGIEVEIVEKDHMAVVTELSQELSSRNVTYDLILMPHRLLGRLVENQQVQPLTPFLKKDAQASFKPEQDLFENWWKETGWYKGELYGFPFTNLTMYVAYQKDLINDPEEQKRFQTRFGRDLTVPKNWSEYIEVAEFFNRPEEGLFGTYIQGQQHVALWYEWLNFAYSFGGRILETEAGSSYGDIVVNSPQNLEATRVYMDLVKYSPPETLNYNWDDALASLQQGRVFMGIIWHDQTPFLEDIEQSKMAGKIGYTTIPTNSGAPKSQLEGWSYLIPKESKNPSEAFEFIRWAMSQSVQVAQTLAGGASALKSTYQDENVKSIPYVPVFLESVPVAIPKPTVPESAQITEVMQKGLSEILVGKVTPKDGLDNIAIQLKEILGDKAQMRYLPNKN